MEESTGHKWRRRVGSRECFISQRSVVLMAKILFPLIALPGRYDDVIVQLKPKIRCNFDKMQR